MKRGSSSILLVQPKTAVSAFAPGPSAERFTAGPNVGVTFTISGVELKGWKGENGLSVYGSTGLPVIQTISLSNGTKFQRICTMQIVSAVPHQ